MNTMIEAFRRVRERIERAAVKAGRDPAAVKLIAVSKTKPATMLAQAMEAGQLDFGENYVQELLDKRTVLPPTLRWHFIGRLQSNKVRQLVGITELVHSVDREKLLVEFERQAEAKNLSVRCLIEVNLDGETSKGGIEPEALFPLLQRSGEFKRVQIRGLMSIPPYCEDPEAMRPFHRRLSELAKALRQQTGMALPELSMGMSGDLDIAVEEGATLVRVGTDLFGPRGKTIL